MAAVECKACGWLGQRKRAGTEKPCPKCASEVRLLERLDLGYERKRYFKCGHEAPRPWNYTERAEDCECKACEWAGRPPAKFMITLITSTGRYKVHTIPKGLRPVDQSQPRRRRRGRFVNRARFA